MYKRATIHYLYAYMYRHTQTDRQTHRHRHTRTHAHTHTHTHPNLNPNPKTYTHAFKKKRGATKKRERKRAKEERDSKLCRRCRACDINESRAPRTFFLASTVAPASSSARTVSVCPSRAEIQSGVRSSCRTGGVRGESCRGGQGAHTYMYTHGCVPGCVCVNQYMNTCEYKSSE